MPCYEFPRTDSFTVPAPFASADPIGGIGGIGAIAFAQVEGNAVQFSSAGSYDLLGPATEQWDFGDSTSSAPAALGTSPSHTYPAGAASYTYTLTVTDTATGLKATTSGTVTIAASGGGPIVVDHVVVAPGSLNGHVGGSGFPVAVIYDAAGHVLSGETITWTSSNHPVIAAPANGPNPTVPYLSVGAANLQAHVGAVDSNVVVVTVSDTVVVTPPAVGGPVTPNLPSGFTTLFEWKCNGVPPPDVGETSGFGLSTGYLRWHNYWTGGPTLTEGSEASAPVDPPGVLVETYPAGLASGTASFDETTWLDAAQSEFAKVYMCRYVRIPGPTFECEPSTHMKLFGFAPCGRKNGAGQGGADNNVILAVFGSGLATAMNLAVEQQNEVARNMVGTGNPLTCGGAWHRLEWLLELDSAPGAADGKLHIWVDGPAHLSVTNVNWRPNAAWAHKFFNLFGPRVWGGNTPGTVKKQTDRFETAYIYVAGHA